MIHKVVENRWKNKEYSPAAELAIFNQGQVIHGQLTRIIERTKNKHKEKCLGFGLYCRCA
jgi:hypothetical protein